MNEKHSKKCEWEKENKICYRSFSLQMQKQANNHIKEVVLMRTRMHQRGFFLFCLVWRVFVCVFYFFLFLVFFIHSFFCSSYCSINNSCQAGFSTVQYDMKAFCSFYSLLFLIRIVSFNFLHHLELWLSNLPYRK